jgi:isopenicillin-N epimerase
MLTYLKSEYLLNPDVIYLNHGSFGACPRPVFETYQRLQRQLEWEPIDFLSRNAHNMLAASRAALAAYLGVGADDVAYFPNPTQALNMVIRSWGAQARPGDEILTTDQEYGALDRTWKFVCGKTGARYVQRHVPLPVTTHADFVEQFWAGVNERTRVIYLSHITSPTALIFPIAEICRRARQAGILTIIDGAHAPSQIPVNLAELGADVYAGACHKWLCAPKGAAFVYVRPEHQHWTEPLVVSFGWQSDHPGPSQYVDYHEWQGTRDLAAFLAVPAAIQFQAEHNWDAVRARCHTLAVNTRERIIDLTDAEPICPLSAGDGAGNWFSQMVVAPLPADTDLPTLSTRLHDEFCIEVPCTRPGGQPSLRISFQAYNSQADADALVDALAKILQG